MKELLLIGGWIFVCVGFVLTGRSFYQVRKKVLDKLSYKEQARRWEAGAKRVTVALILFVLGMVCCFSSIPL